MDRRRVNAPETTFLPLFKDQISPAIPKPKKKRSRDENAARPVYLRTGLITQANGSSYIEMQGTKVACAVYGPRQSKTLTFSDRATVNCEIKFAPFSSLSHRGHQRDSQEKYLSTHIQHAIIPTIRFDTLSHKANIDIFITVLETDGLASTVAGAITCVSCAIADAGIEMYGLISSAAISVRGESIYLDPTESDEDETDEVGSAVMLVAYNNALSEVTHVWQTGSISAEVSIDAMEQCVTLCTQISHVMNKSLLENTTTK